MAQQRLQEEGCVVDIRLTVGDGRRGKAMGAATWTTTGDDGDGGGDGYGNEARRGQQRGWRRGAAAMSIEAEETKKRIIN